MKILLHLFPKYISIPLDLEILKDATGNDNKIGIAFSYHPGQSYSFGDTCLISMILH